MRRETARHARLRRWCIATPLAVVVAAGVSLSGGVAHAGVGGTVQGSVTDLHGAAENGVCFEVIVPDARNTNDNVVTTTAPTGADGTDGHFTQANVPAGSYIGKYVDCGAPTSFAPFYTGGTFNKAKARPFGVTDGGNTDLGIQMLQSSGTAGSISGVVLDGSQPGQGVADISVAAYTTGQALVATTCTDPSGNYTLFDLPGTGGGIRLDFGKPHGCSNDGNFATEWYGGAATYAAATPIAITANDNVVASSTTLALKTKAGVTVTAVSFGGDPSNPVITVTGTGFGKLPKPDPTDRPCGEDDVAGSGYDYGNRVVFWDLGSGAGWQVGFPGDCIGVIFQSYSSTQIVFTLNDWYRAPGNVGRPIAVNDPFTIRIKGAPLTGTVTSIG